MRALQARARRRAERGRADEPGVAHARELRFDQVDAALLDERDAEQRLVGAIEDTADGGEHRDDSDDEQQHAGVRMLR